MRFADGEIVDRPNRKSQPSTTSSMVWLSNLFQPTISHIGLDVKTPDSRIIKHEFCDILGETTNVLVYAYLDNNKPQKFTREEIRIAVEQHKVAREEEGLVEQRLSRIRTGKATVNYWIDRLVENNSIEKLHSNPVLFWREGTSIISTQNRIRKTERLMPLNSWGW